MMLIRLLLLLCLTGYLFATEPSDVDCLVVHLKYVHCFWNKEGTPEVNYTFYSRFASDTTMRNCTTYLSEKGTNTGCIQPYEVRTNRFKTFYTKLVHGNQSLEKELNLKMKVKLNPPINVTVLMGSDSNLWYYWNQSFSSCVDSEVRYRINKKGWETSTVTTTKQSYCINMPSNRSEYELQVRSKMTDNCGGSIYWSDWSEPVVWGSNNSTDINQINRAISVWNPVLSVLGVLIFILLVVMLLHHERVRIILLPAVPKPALISHDMQDWLQISKGLKENFNPNYNELACPVREYCPVTQSDSESLDGSSSVTSGQTDCSILIPADESSLSTPCSSSTSTVLASSEEAEQISI